MASTRQVHLVFGSVMALLAGFVATHFYVNQGKNVPVAAAQVAGASAGERLPENHPPLETARELITLEELARNDPTNADYRTRIGNIYYDMRQYRKAAESYRRSLELRPADPSVETDLATCYHNLGEHDSALEILNRVLGYSPNFPQALLNKGVVLLAGRNDRQGAIAAWERLLQAHPDFPQRADLEARLNQLKSR